METVERRPVAVTGIGLLCPAGIGSAGADRGEAGAVPGFRPRDYVPDRKQLKVMTRAVRLGVAGIKLALDSDPTWTQVPPERRGIFVGASPQPGDPDDLRPALQAACTPDGEFDQLRFNRDGYPLIHPLWLIRGLSNNVLGFASAIHDLQGVNMNYCDGPDGGWNAVVEGWHAVSSGRADLVVAGGGDAWIGADELMGMPCGEGAAFLVLRPCLDGIRPFVPDRTVLDPALNELGYLGSATWPVALARELFRPPIGG